MWISHLGCLKGCLDYLQADISDAWLFGASGHAFILNVHQQVCPSGPTAWRKEKFLDLIQNIGVVNDAVVSHKSMKDFEEKQRLIWDRLRESIDANQPCFGWEFGFPEYYVVTGYDDTGYYYSGPKPEFADCPEPLSWRKLGTSEIGILEVYFVQLVQPLDDLSIVQYALQFAKDFSDSPAAWLFEKYKAGLEGFDLWIGALRHNNADSWGSAFNAVVWAECRGYAEQFMREAEQRIGGQYSPLFIEAAEHYGEVARNLKSLTEVFPFPPKKEHIQEEDRRQKGVEILINAKEAEDRALKTIDKILEKFPGSTGGQSQCD